MKHDLRIDGFAFRLRPVDEDDAERMVELRTQPELNKFLPTISPDPEVQRAYIRDYFERPGDFYFMVERISNGHAEGNIAVYDVDEENRCAEWGRWILEAHSPAAIESAWLVFRVAFEILDLDYLYCRTNVENRQTVSFHDSCGLSRQRTLSNFIELNGVPYDAIEHRLNRQSWHNVDANLRSKSDMVSKILLRGA